MNFKIAGKLATYAVIILLGLAVLNKDVFSQDNNTTNAVSTGVPFLLIGPNSRFSGMGETGAGIADDATAMHWNPSGLAFQTGEDLEINFTHSQWLAGLGIGDLFYDYVSSKKYMKSLNGTIGASLTYLNIGEIIYTDELGNTDPSRNYKAYEMAFAVGYGTKLSSDWGIGVVTRFIYSRLSPDDLTVGGEQGTGTAFTTSFDLSGMWRPSKGPNFLKNKLSLGLNLSNLGPKITYVDADQADPIPTQLRFGLAYQLMKNEGNELTLAADFSKILVRRYMENGEPKSDPFYKAVFSSWGEGDLFKSIQSSVGVEYWYGSPRLIALRAGFFYEDPSNGNRRFITLGAGIRYSKYGFDFSYIDALVDNHPLANTLRFGLIANF